MAIRKQIDTLYNSNTSDIMTEDRYGFIEGALKENQIADGSRTDSINKKLDNLLTHKVLSLPIFFGTIFLVFFMTFNLGNYPVAWLENLLMLAGRGVTAILPDWMLTMMIIPFMSCSARLPV